MYKIYENFYFHGEINVTFEPILSFCFGLIPYSLGITPSASNYKDIEPKFKQNTLNSVSGRNKHKQIRKIHRAKHAS